MELVKLEIIGYFMTLLVLCFGPCFVKSSRDLALNKTATQSSTYSDSQSYDAGRAVDGVLARDVTDGHCSHTDSGHRQAWWKVDLGQFYRIQVVNITYRYSQTDRLKSYSIYVTNNTDMTQAIGSISEQSGHLCYHDTESGTPTYNQSRECHVTGRYVVFYNTRQHGEAYVELCGVQVYGCRAGRFGFNCRDTCHCATGGCNPDTGQCDVPGCQTGWMGLSCSLRCHCISGGACNPNTGACPGRCQSGWSGRSCFVGPRDLAHNKRTRQSSTYNRDEGRFGSGKAVDGVITADVSPNGSCSHTDQTRIYPEAWWQVDLGEIERIQTINIIYRQLYPFRMSGFYLYVSNSSYTNSQSLSRDYLCYHDHGPGLPSYIQSLPCSVHGRYVTFYNKRPADYEPRNVTYYSETTAIITLCEVQVLGGCSAGLKGDSCNEDCEHGLFGQGCSQTCHCATADCNKRTGTCGPQGCSAGWKGLTCSQACDTGTFGQNCHQQCHCSKQDCDKKLGRCTGECLAGWQGDSCNQACDHGTFGQNCTQQCHCSKQDCDKQTGGCTGGCLAGWQGDSCNQACIYGKFGQGCNQNCHCAASDCNKETGMCGPPGCSAGWKGTTCSQECSSGHFGWTCSEVCHCQQEGCDHVNGRCDHAGCQAGWSGQSCNKQCVNNTFGRDCNQTCHCANPRCNRTDGVCSVPGCTEGWMGNTCSQECFNPTFGRDCNQTCHCAISGCDRVSGVCTIPGCTEGWNGYTCSQGCVNNTFGRDCKQTCHCAYSSCDRVSGVCTIPGCTEGWNGDTCSQEYSAGYFGLNCYEMCHCKEGRCDHLGCQEGWSGQACDQRCVNNTFGRDCNQTCNCAISGCDRVSGVCTIPRCREGWSGDTCSQEQISQNQTEVIGCFASLANTKDVTGYAILGTVLAISIFYNIGLTMFCLRQSRKIKSPPKPSTAYEMQPNSVSQDHSNYEGLDITKVDNVKNIYDTIGK
ncbi:multiple epidermal growth factor-like domains protein 11 isoform X2 [Mizuhopecten yessoensis]|uniref:multiple epidermal growth factor-like domains protein 11 isoform X2 n=1 Tax=Mizuhopecten yessoensis TaxID=6573 RepID=UPI000B45B5BD|nr:multiple epidermal growth factor-like domains protein 11 isoform X2 [Mizuhopecten yessoensis]